MPPVHTLWERGRGRGVGGFRHGVSPLSPTPLPQGERGYATAHDDDAGCTLGTAGEVSQCELLECIHDMNHEAFRSAVICHLRTATAFQDALEGLAIGNVPREHISRRLWILANQDGASFGALLKLGHVGSALALIRPQTEAFLRGCWARWFATDVQLCQIAEGTGRFELLAQTLKDLDSLQLPVTICGRELDIVHLSRAAVSKLHDLTHRGTLALDLLSVCNASLPFAAAPHFLAALDLTIQIGALSAAAALEDAGDSEAGNALLVRADEFRLQANHWLDESQHPQVDSVPGAKQ